MLRKVTISLLATVLVAGTVTAVPASGATKISNGVACKKANAKTKSGGSTYICTKNQLVKNSKLTWLSQDCVTTVNAYLKSKANLPKIKAETDATVAKLEADILIQKTENEKATKLVAEYQGKIQVLQTAIDSLKADTVNAVKNKPTITKYENAVKSYEAAIKAYGAVSRGLTRSVSAVEQARAGYENTVIELATGLSMAKLICEKGF